MAQVTIIMVGKKEGVTDGNYNATRDRYLAIAGEENLIVPANGFTTFHETEDSDGNFHVDTVLFKWHWRGQHTQVPTIWAALLALTVAEGFALEFFYVQANAQGA